MTQNMTKQAFADSIFLFSNGEQHKYYIQFLREHFSMNALAETFLFWQASKTEDKTTHTFGLVLYSGKRNTNNKNKTPRLF